MHSGKREARGRKLQKEVVLGSVVNGIYTV